MKTTSTKATSSKSSTSLLTGRERAALLRKAEKEKAEKLARLDAHAAYEARCRAAVSRHERALAAFKKKAEPKLGSLGCSAVFNVVLVTGTSTPRPSTQQMWSFSDLAAAKAAMEKLLQRAAYEELVNRKASSHFLAEPNGFRIVQVAANGLTQVVVPTVSPRQWMVDTFGG